MKLKLFFLTVLTMFSLWACDTAEDDENAVINSKQDVEETTGFNVLNSSDFTVKWKINGENITFTLKAKTTGWVAIGIGATKKMKDANIIIGYVKNGEAYVEDHYGDSETTHKSDISLGGTNDVIDYSGTEENGVTTLTFTIPLDSGDFKDVKIEKGKSYTVILAFGSDGDDDFTGFHKKTAVTSITF